MKKTYSKKSQTSTSEKENINPVADDLISLSTIDDKKAKKPKSNSKGKKESKQVDQKAIEEWKKKRAAYFQSVDQFNLEEGAAVEPPKQEVVITSNLDNLLNTRFVSYIANKPVDSSTRDLQEKARTLFREIPIGSAPPVNSHSVREVEMTNVESEDEENTEQTLFKELNRELETPIKAIPKEIAMEQQELDQALLEPEEDDLDFDLGVTSLASPSYLRLKKSHPQLAMEYEQYKRALPPTATPFSFQQYLSLSLEGVVL